jgi:borealin
MAPKKRSSRGTRTNTLRSRKLASFLKDFDREGKGWIRVIVGFGWVGTRMRRLRTPDAGSVRFHLFAVQVRTKQIESDRQTLLKEVENLYNIEILRLPKALQGMKWLDYFGKSC